MVPHPILACLIAVILPLEVFQYCVLLYDNKQQHNEVEDHDLLAILESCLTLVSC